MEKDDIWDVLRQGRTDLERKQEALERQCALLDTLESALETIAKLEKSNKALAAELENANKQIDTQTIKNEKLQSENDELKRERDALRIRLTELCKMTTNVAEKTQHEELKQALRKYMNMSRRKTVQKRGIVKTAILEIVTSTGVILPEDMALELESFDDEIEKTVTTMTFTEPVGQIIANVESLNNNPAR